MSRPFASASRLPLLSKCVGSAVLPQISSSGEPAALGSAKHESLAMRVVRSHSDTLDAWDDITKRWEIDERDAGIAWTELRDFLWMPPKGAAAEVGLCLLEDGSVVRVPGGRGNYPALPDGALLPGQLDLMWSEPEPLDFSDPAHPRCPAGSVLTVIDYKTGEPANVTVADRNEQLLVLGLMAARWTGAESVRVGVCFPGKGEGLWDVTGALRTAALSRIEGRVHALAAHATVQRQALAEKRHLELVEGSHCTYCPSSAACPAKTSAVRALVDSGVDAFAPGALEPEVARKAALMLPIIEGLGRKMREALKAHVAACGPIPVGTNVEWGPVLEGRDEIDFAKALDVLCDELGVARARSAATISKSAIEKAIGELHAEQGIKKQKSAAMCRVLARLHEDGAITRGAIEIYKPHRTDLSAPGLELPAAPEKASAA